MGSHSTWTKQLHAHLRFLRDGRRRRVSSWPWVAGARGSWWTGPSRLSISKPLYRKLSCRLIGEGMGGFLLPDDSPGRFIHFTSFPAAAAGVPGPLDPPPFPVGCFTRKPRIGQLHAGGARCTARRPTASMDDFWNRDGFRSACAGGWQRSTTDPMPCHEISLDARLRHSRSARDKTDGRGCCPYRDGISNGRMMNQKTAITDSWPTGRFGFD